MINTGKHIIQQGLTSGFIDPQLQTQPTGFDISVKNISSFSSKGTIDFDNSKRDIATRTELTPTSGNYALEQGTYMVEFNEQINVKPNYVFYLHPRSSLMRNGATLSSSIFDPGYSGPIFAILQVLNPLGINVKKDARIGQIVCHSTKQNTTSLYQGIYNTALSKE